MPLKLIMAIALSSSFCLAAAAQSSSKYLKSMKQEGYTLYFITPASFKAPKGKIQLEADFTFQYHGSRPEEVSLRFSIFSKAPLREMEYLSFQEGTEILGRSAGSELMFLEQRKGRWHARFATHIPYSTLMKMLEAGEDLKIRLHNRDTDIVFPAGKHWRKASAVVKEILKAETGGG